MDTATFTTSHDALDSIREALGEYADDHDHDLRAIFEEAFDYDYERQVFVQAVDFIEFWAIVERNAVDA
jgi:hypothetical protein